MLDAIDDANFVELMDPTVEASGGELEDRTYAADRCKVRPQERSLSILRRLLGHGDGWERDHVERAAIEALGIARHLSGTPVWKDLRVRLLQRGHHEVHDIQP